MFPPICWGTWWPAPTRAARSACRCTRALAQRAYANCSPAHPAHPASPAPAPNTHPPTDNAEPATDEAKRGKQRPPSESQTDGQESGAADAELPGPATNASGHQADTGGEHVDPGEATVTEPALKAEEAPGGNSSTEQPGLPHQHDHRGASDARFNLTGSVPVYFVSTGYRIVFMLDVSPSVACVEPGSGRVPLDQLRTALEHCLRDVVVPFSAPGSDRVLVPELRVTVLAQTDPRLKLQHAVQVLLQNALATPDTVDTILAVVKANMTVYENTISKVGGAAPRPPPPPSAHMGADEAPSFERITYLKRDRVLMEGIQNAIFAMSRMPPTLSPILVVITDGVSSFPNVATMFSALQALWRTDITCSFIQVGQESMSPASLGNVPDSELLRFFAASAGGRFEFLDEIATHGGAQPNNGSPAAMNMCHYFLLATPLYLNKDWVPGGGGDGKLSLDFQSSQEVIVSGPTSSIFTNNLDASTLFIPVVRRKWKSYNLKCFILNIVSSRLKVGFLLSQINMAQGNRNTYAHLRPRRTSENSTKVLLTLPFQQHIRVECTLSSEWAGSMEIAKYAQSRTHIRFDLVAPHLVHRQLSSIQRQSSLGNDAATTCALRLLETLERLLDSDTHLARMHDFAAHQDLLRNAPDEILTLAKQQEEDTDLGARPTALFVLDLCDKLDDRMHPLTKSFVDYWRRVTSLNQSSLSHYMQSCVISTILSASKASAPSHGAGVSDNLKDHTQEAVAFQLLLERLSSFASFGLTEGVYVRVVKTDWISTVQYSYCVMKISRKHALVATWIGFLDVPDKVRLDLLHDLKNNVLCGPLTHPPRHHPNSSSKGRESSGRSTPRHIRGSTNSTTFDKNHSDDESIQRSEDESESDTEDRYRAHTWHGMHQDDQQRWLSMFEGTSTRVEDSDIVDDDAVADVRAKRNESLSEASETNDAQDAAFDEPDKSDVLENSSGVTKSPLVAASAELHRVASTPSPAFERDLSVGSSEIIDQDVTVALDHDGLIQTPVISVGSTEHVLPDEHTRPKSFVLQNNLVALLSGSPACDQVEAHVNSYGCLTGHVWHLKTAHDYNDEDVAIDIAGGVIVRGIKNLRLNDGFRQVLSLNGVTTFVKEFKMHIHPPAPNTTAPDLQDPLTSGKHAPEQQGGETGMQAEGSCMIHYTVSASDDTDTVLSQMWVEPQCGHVVSDLTHFNGLSFDELSDRIFYRDQQFISAVCTFQYLEILSNLQLATELDIHGLPNLPPVLDLRSTSQPRIPPKTFTNGASTKDMRFQLDLVSIIEHTHSVEIRFPGFSDELASHMVAIRTNSLPITHVKEDRSATYKEEDGFESTITYQSSSDFRQDLLVNMLRTACGVEVTLDAQSSANASKLFGSDDPKGHNNYHCFVTTFDDHIVLTLVASPRIVSESPPPPQTKDENECNKDYHGIVRVFECKKDDIRTSSSSREKKYQHDIIDFANERLCNMNERLPDISGSKSLPHYITVLCSLYVKCFVASIYWCLQLNLPVTKQDMHNARDVCASRDEEVNLTQLLKRLAVKTDRQIAPGLNDEDHRKNVRERFLEVLGDCFSQVETDATMWYLLAPRASDVSAEVSREDPFPGSDTAHHSQRSTGRASVVIESSDETDWQGFKKRSSILSLSSSFTFGLIHDLLSVNHADDMDGTPDDVMAEPMFLSMECSLKRSAKSGGQLYSSMPIKELPLSVWDLVTGEEPGAQGLDEALESGSVSIILHVTVHTIQDAVSWVDDDIDVNSTVTDMTHPYAQSVSDCTDIVFDDKQSDFGAPLPHMSVLYGDEDDIGLSQFHMNIFNRVRKEVTWFVQDEVLSLTRRDEPAHKDHILACIDHLKRSQNDSSLTTKSFVQRMHLQFVQPSGVAMFKKELTFRQLQHFYVQREKDVIFLEPMPGTDWKSVAVLQPDEAVPEVWVNTPPTGERVVGKDHQNSIVPFYLILAVADKHVDLFFHTRSLAPGFESSVVDAVRMLVSRVQFTVLHPKPILAFRATAPALCV